MSLKPSDISLKTVHSRARGRGVIALPFEQTSDDARYATWPTAHVDSAMSGVL
ncbi:hypothetical protein [Aliiruegeria sabulilitoris]|uniref:hypothetical protein n=1 Tax=Aliiruegeria sabulilitoris TaxID=1510458 RepID=UPI0012E36A8A|nr:hypothetical protein [Aliiruegeria sabulilitoris]